ncbi:MAG: COP23 domain-containing protein [Microcystaceae cyanobacterium]
MMSNLSLSLTPVLIASLVSLTPSVAWSQTEDMSQPRFICQSEQTPPRTVVQMDGETDVVATWYSEYLLENTSATEICQEVAQTLQQRYERQQPSLFAYQAVNPKERLDVCLVSEEGQICTEEDSKVLFSLNNRYKEPADCILKNKPPQTDGCKRLPDQLRGSLVSVPSGRGYSPGWLRIFKIGN